MKRSHFLLVLVQIALFAAVLQAKNESAIVMTWPADKPAIKLTFQKFREVGSYNGQNSFTCEVTVQNLSDKQIPRAAFTVYLSDKSKVRIGEGLLQVADLD